MTWERNHAECYSYHSYDIDEFYYDKSEWNVPQFMFPWSWEKQHQEEPVKPLFQTCTFWCDVDKRISVVAVYHADRMFVGNEIDVQQMFQNPAALIEQQR